MVIKLDVHSKEVRSYNMSQIRSKDTKPEVKVRRYLFSHGFRYRKNDKRYPGHPDIVLPKYHTIIFINGCFWHMHIGCKDFSMPKSNTEFWSRKLKRNYEHDQEIYQQLHDLGWNIIVLWQCELKNSNFENRMKQLTDEITSR